MSTGERGDNRTIRIQESTFCLEAVKRASYALMARLNVAIEREQDGIVCTLAAARPGEDLDRLERDFRREVLDQDLRLSLEAKTEPVRSAILGLAFSRTGLQHE